LHDLALAIAALEIAELDIEIAGLLSPDVRNRLVDRLAVFAMAAGADLDFLVQCLRVQRRDRQRRRSHDAANEPGIKPAAHRLSLHTFPKEAGPQAVPPVVDDERLTF